MERDFMGLNTFIKKEECKQTDCFEAFNKYQDSETQNAHFLQLDINKQVASVPVMRPHFSVAHVNQHVLEGVRVLPSTAMFFPHKTQPWYNRVKVDSVPSAQLTIFYGGTVNVYDGISPEKAQAIMLMAGTGAFVATPNAPRPRVHTPMTPTPISNQPCSDVSSPMSVSSHPVCQSTNKNEATKRVVSSIGAMMQSAIPQARKASLARFLEKRKERMLASAPYSFSKNTADYFASSSYVVVANE